VYFREYVLHRHENNPILSPRGFPGVTAIFNPGQTTYQGKTILLCSVNNPLVGRARAQVAESEDGVSFTLRQEPFITGWDEPPFDFVLNSPIDSRITRIGDTYYIVNPAPGEDFDDCIARICFRKELRPRGRRGHEDMISAEVLSPESQPEEIPVKAREPVAV